MKEILSTNGAPSAVGPYSQAVRAGNTIYLSGQLGLDPNTGKLVADDVVAQTKQCLANIKAVLTHAGASFDNVVKTTVFLTRIEDFAAVNKEYATCFTHDYPARSCFAVKELPLGALVEIESIAVL